MSDQLKLPPFDIDGSVAVAYVRGRYAAPSSRKGPKGFLGLYLSDARLTTRFSFWSFSMTDERLSYESVSPDDASLELALIWGRQYEGIPFEQWRPYPIRAEERKALGRRRLRRRYDEVRRSLAWVLYLTRMPIYIPGPRAAPLFAIEPRSRAAIRADEVEWQEVMRAVTS